MFAVYREGNHGTRDGRNLITYGKVVCCVLRVALGRCSALHKL